MDMSESVEPISRDESPSRAWLVSGAESLRGMEPMRGEGAFLSCLVGQWDVDTTLLTVPYLSSSSGECWGFNIYIILHKTQTVVFASTFLLNCSSPQLMSPFL